MNLALKVTQERGRRAFLNQTPPPDHQQENNVECIFLVPHHAPLSITKTEFKRRDSNAMSYQRHTWAWQVISYTGSKGNLIDNCGKTRMKADPLTKLHWLHEA